MRPLLSTLPVILLWPLTLAAQDTARYSRADTLLILGLVAGGIGLVARSLKSYSTPAA